MTIPIRDAIMIFKTELEARSEGYYDYLGNGGRGDCAEEARLDALQLVIELLEKQEAKKEYVNVELDMQTLQKAYENTVKLINDIVVLEE